MVQYIVEGAKRRNITAKRRLEFVIATNLAVITSQMLDFCRQHSILISTSLDGPRTFTTRIGRDLGGTVISGQSRESSARERHLVKTE
jgi:Arylsulfatase regulator (Fe-S oxidoreductase)